MATFLGFHTHEKRVLPVGRDDDGEVKGVRRPSTVGRWDKTAMKTVIAARPPANTAPQAVPPIRDLQVWKVALLRRGSEPVQPHVEMPRTDRRSTWGKMTHEYNERSDASQRDWDKTTRGFNECGT